MVCQGDHRREGGASRSVAHATDQTAWQECARWPTNKDRYELLRPGRVGPVVVGMSRAELRRRCPGLRDSAAFGAEGIPRRVTVLAIAGERVGLVEWDDTRDTVISRVLVESPILQTPDSIGVGTTVGRLRQKLGGLAAGYDDAAVYVWSEAQPGMSFIVRFRVSSVLASPDDIARRPDLVPDTASVRMVILVAPRPQFSRDPN